jgi:hypothetical protein
MQHIHSRLLRLESFLLPQVPESPLLGYNNRESLYSWQPQLSSPPPLLWNEVTTIGAQSFLTALTQSIFHSDNITATEDDICDAYFRHVNKWLPIISQKKFYTQLASGRPTNRRPETELLLMCMYLMVRDPPDLDPSEENHYKSVRLAYCMLQAESTDLLQLAQSGLILATYEHASGHVEQAYSTIWTCVQMMHSLRLEDKLQTSKDSDHDKQTECAEAYALWWAILIRDR